MNSVIVRWSKRARPQRCTVAVIGRSCQEAIGHRDGSGQDLMGNPSVQLDD